MANFVCIDECAALNIVLDLWFAPGPERGVAGAAEAAVIAQYISGLGIAWDE